MLGLSDCSSTSSIMLCMRAVEAHAEQLPTALCAVSTLFRSKGVILDSFNYCGNAGMCFANLTLPTSQAHAFAKSVFSQEWKIPDDVMIILETASGETEAFVGRDSRQLH